jgi:endo-1,4-beta-xylanase
MRWGWTVWVAGVIGLHGAPAESWNNPPKERIDGLEHRTFQSRSMHCDVGFNIYFPPQYRTQEGKKFPVIYHLSGMGDTESSELDLVPILDRAIRQGTVPPLILVMVNGGKLSFYADSVDGKVLAETAFIKELIPHVDATCRTVASREGRGLHGFSMGGFGALKFAAKYPEMFSSVMAYATGLYDGQMMKEKLPKVLAATFDNDPRRFDYEAPRYFLEFNGEKVRGKISIRLVVGSKELLLELCRRMHQYMDEKKIPHQYEEIAGVGHKSSEMFEKTGLRGLEFLAKSLTAER